MDAPSGTGSTLRLAIGLFAALLGAFALIYGTVAWWLLSGPGSPCWELRNDPLAVCHTGLWSFEPSPVDGIAWLTLLFAICLIAAKAWRARPGRKL